MSAWEDQLAVLNAKVADLIALLTTKSAELSAALAVADAERVRADGFLTELAALDPSEEFAGDIAATIALIEAELPEEEEE